MDHLELCGGVAKESMCARHVPRREDKPVTAPTERLEEVLQHVAQARKVLKGSEFQDLIQQEGRGAVSGCPRLTEEG